MDTLRTLLLSLLIVIAGGATLAAATDGFRAFTTESARRLAVREHAVPVPDFPLQSASGGHFTLQDLRGHWLLVDFVYARCQAWCSVLGGEFAQLQDLLAAPIAQDRLRLLSISFDPVNDDPAQLAAYQHRFGDRGHGWIAARPLDGASLNLATRVFGIRVIADGTGGYIHNASIALVDPQGRLVRIFDSGRPDVVAAALQEMLAQ